MRKPPSWLPLGYVLNESDPDIVVLCREDGSVVATFSAMGATRESIHQAAEEDQQRASSSSEPDAPSPEVARPGRQHLAPF